MNFLKWALEYIDDLINPDTGRSVKSWVYLFIAVCAGLSGLAMALSAAFVGVFIVLAPFISSLVNEGACKKIEMDGAFWPAFFLCLGGLFAALFGYAASAKKAGDDATKEIELAKLPAPVVAPAPTVTTTKVELTKETSAPAPKKK